MVFFSRYRVDKLCERKKKPKFAHFRPLVDCNDCWQVVCCFLAPASQSCLASVLMDICWLRCRVEGPYPAATWARRIGSALGDSPRLEGINNNTGCGISHRKL